MARRSLPPARTARPLAEAEAAEAGGDSPRDPGVLSLIPGLAQLLDTGLVSAFEAPLASAVESWVEGQVPAGALGFPGPDDLLFAADTLQGVVNGDPDCCLMFGGSATSTPSPESWPRGRKLETSPRRPLAGCSTWTAHARSLAGRTHAQLVRIPEIEN